MAFLRVVEVLPPLFPVSRSRTNRLAVDAALRHFTEQIRGIRRSADIILVANVKNQRRLKIDALHVAAMLQEHLRIEAAPVIIVRDQNRPQFLSTVLTAISIGLKSMMIAWGDDYPDPAEVTNVRDFPSLAKAIREASLIRERARASTRIFAPVDINSLAYHRGVSLAKERLKAGADTLLAQPPTTDAEESFEHQAELIEKAGLKGRVLLNVFPFRDSRDVRRYERIFGWKLPNRLHQVASKGETQLVGLERGIVRRLRGDGYPGIYLTTRGAPAIAKRLLS